jgi:hypothetical protein
MELNGHKEVPTLMRSPSRKVAFYCFGFLFLLLILAPGFQGSAVGSQDNVPAGPTVKKTQIVDPSQVTFVQVTDAHIFDAGKRASTENGAKKEQADSWDALHWSITQTNQLLKGGAEIEFVVFTGDFGLEYVRSPGEAPCNNNAKDLAAFEDIRKRGWPKLFSASEAARRVAEQLRHLQVRTVYLVPGNNDLIMEDPCDIDRYRNFVKQLREQMPLGAPLVADLSEVDASNTPQYGIFRLLGLNSASFKIQQNFQNGCDNAKAGYPLFEMTRLDKLIHSEGDHLYLIFTHVPDLKDPQNLKDKSQQCDTLGLHPMRSACDAWKDFPDCARNPWESIAISPNVAAIFAGHFHSSNRALYSTSGAETPLAIHPDIARKTWVAPPLALKFQENAVKRARGFLLVRVLQRSSGPGAVVSAIPFWYSEPMGCVWTPLLLSVLTGIALIAILLVWMTTLRSAHSPFLTVNLLTNPVVLTLLGFLMSGLLVWVTIAFLINDLHIDRPYVLVPIFGAVGGVVAAIRRQCEFLFCSLETTPGIKMGALGDVLIGIGGATAIVFVFGTALHFQPEHSESVVLLISVSFLAGVFGRNIVQAAGEKLVRQIAREEATAAAKVVARDEARSVTKQEVERLNHPSGPERG